MKMKNKDKNTNKKTTKKRNILATVIIIIVAIAISLGILLAFVLNRLSVLSNRISYLSDTADIILNNVSTLQSNIEATLEEESSLLESWSVDLLYTDFRTKTYTVDVTIIPKSYTDTTRAIIYFGTNEYELRLDGYSYKSKIVLPLGEKYDGNVTVLFIDGDKKATEVISGYKDVQHDFDDVLSGNATEMPVYKDGKLKIDGAFDFVLQGDDNFKFTSLELIVDAGKKDIDTVDLKKLAEEQMGITDESGSESEDSDTIEDTGNPDSLDNTDNIENTDNTDDMDNQNPNDDVDNPDENGNSGAKIDTEEKSTGKLTLAETTEKEESRKHVEETVVPTSFAGTYEMKGEYEVENSQNIRIYLRAETEDGFVFEYDLFNATTVSALVESTIDEDKDATGFETKANYFAGNYSVYDSKGAKYEKN